MASKAINTILNLKDNYSKTIKQATSSTNIFQKGIAKTTSILSGLKNTTTSTFSNITKTAVGLGVSYMGIKGAVSYVKEGMEMARNSQLATAQLGAVLASTNNAIGMTKDQLLDLAGSYGSYTTYTKGAVLEGENLLLTFTGIGKDVLPDTTTTMLDMATAMKQDVSSSAMMLGKALNDPTAGLSKLTKQGVNFSEQQKKQIETMQKAGNVAGAQKLMLAELQKEFGGSAKAAGETIPGKLQILKNTFNGLKKAVGEKFIPVLYEIVKFATDHLPQIKAIFLTVFDNVGKIVNGAVDIFKNNLMPVFLEVWQHVEPYIIKIRDFLPEAFEKVKEVAGNVFNGIKNFIDDNKESVGKFIGKFIDLAKSIWDDLSPAIENIITNLLPKLQEGFGGNSGAIKNILDKATDVFDFINNNWKEIKPIILTIVGALGAYKLALLAIEINTTIVHALTTAWLFITGVIETITGATSIWAGVQEVLNGVMMANPIGFIITLIAGLSLAIYEVVTHWQQIVEWCKKTWDILTDNPILMFIATIISPLALALLAIVSHWKEICEWVEKAWDWLTKWNDTEAKNKEITITETNQTKQTQGAGSDFMDTFNANYDAGNNATGTNYWKGGRTWVGEHGKELVDLPSGSKVHTASASKKMTNGEGHTFNFNFTGNVGTEEFLNQVGEHIVNKVSLVLNNNM